MANVMYFNLAGFSPDLVDDNLRLEVPIAEVDFGRIGGQLKELGLSPGQVDLLFEEFHRAVEIQVLAVILADRRN